MKKWEEFILFKVEQGRSVIDPTCHWSMIRHMLELCRLQSRQFLDTHKMEIVWVGFVGHSKSVVEYWKHNSKWPAMSLKSLIIICSSFELNACRTFCYCTPRDRAWEWYTNEWLARDRSKAVVQRIRRSSILTSYRWLSQCSSNIGDMIKIRSRFPKVFFYISFVSHGYLYSFIYIYFHCYSFNRNNNLLSS